MPLAESPAGVPLAWANIGQARDGRSRGTSWPIPRALPGRTGDNRDPGQLYARSGESVRVVLNKAFFVRLYVDGRKITGEETREPFALLRGVYEIYTEHRDSGRTVTIRPRTGHQDGPTSGTGSGGEAGGPDEAEGSEDGSRGVVPKDNAPDGKTLIHLPDGSPWDEVLIDGSWWS